MARIVLRDTTMTRAQVRNRADKDIRSSHFENVLFADNCDFTGYDLRDVTFFDCRLRGAILPAHTIDGVAATDYLWSWHTNWAGAALPANMAGCQKEWRTELWSQIAANNPRADGLFEWMRDHFIANSDSMAPLFNIKKALERVSPAELRQFLIDLYGPYPRLLETARKFALAYRAGIHEVATPGDNIPVVRGDSFFPDEVSLVLNRADSPTNDRFVVSEFLSNRLSLHREEPWLVHVSSMLPSIQVDTIRASEATRWDWWWQSWA